MYCDSTPETQWTCPTSTRTTDVPDLDTSTTEEHILGSNANKIYHQVLMVIVGILVIYIRSM